MKNNVVHVEKNKILLVDDDVINREMVKNVFSDQYAFLEAENGVEGLEALEREFHGLCAILLDVNMPVMDGIEMLRRLSARGIPQCIPVFLITAREEMEVAREAYGLGVMDVITKPLVPFVIQRRVRSVIELFQSRERLDTTVRLQQAKLRENADTIDELHRGTIETLASAIEFRDVESGEHTGRIYGVTRYLLTHTEMGAGFTAEEIENMAVGAIMHDVGKISISDVILNKPGPLTHDEFEVMKLHTVKGAQLMENLSQLQNHESYAFACDIARHHHERWDGRGYPDGLKGDEITPWAQVVSIADVYDALISPRVYKAPYLPDEAVDMICRGKCGVFNPKLVDCFLQVEPELRKMYFPEPGQQGTQPRAMEQVNRLSAQLGQQSREVEELLLLMAAARSAYDMILSANLTRNSFYMIDYIRFVRHKVGSEGIYDELMQEAAEKVAPTHRQRFREVMDRENLLQEWQHRHNNISLSAPQLGNDGKFHMVSTTVLFQQDKRSGDVKAVLLVRYIDEEWREQQRTRTLLESALALAEDPGQEGEKQTLTRVAELLRSALAEQDPVPVG